MINAVAAAVHIAANNAPPASQGKARRRRWRRVREARGPRGVPDDGGEPAARDEAGEWDAATSPEVAGLSERTALGGLGTDTGTHLARAIGRHSMAPARRQGSHHRRLEAKNRPWPHGRRI